MHAAALLVASLVASLSAVAAERISIQVGANKTANASLIFQPQEVHANAGDVVVFNFTNGTYDVIQSQFDQPCIPAHVYNVSVNGFNSNPRPTINGTAVTQLEVAITDNTTAIWFYENSTCSQGGVGVINANDSSTATLAGFVRNAERLNGTATSSSASPSSTAPSPSSSGQSGSGASSGGNSTSDNAAMAGRHVMLGAVVGVPLALVGLML